MRACARWRCNSWMHAAAQTPPERARNARAQNNCTDGVRAYLEMINPITDTCYAPQLTTVMQIECATECVFIGVSHTFPMICDDC